MTRVYGQFEGGQRTVAFRPGVQMGEKFLPATGDRQIQTNRDGAFAVTLESGQYQVLHGGIPQWRIRVPSDDGEHHILRLIVESYPQRRPRQSSASGDASDRVAKSGDAMSGPLILHAAPEDLSPPLQAATKSYVDAQVALAASRHLHTQMVPATEWIVTHGLGRYPVVNILDFDLREVGGVVEHLSTNQFRVRFGSPRNGYAPCA